MKKKLFVIFVMVCLLCIACGQKEKNEEEALKEKSNRPEKLVVYINGSPNTIESQYVSDEFYPTNYTIGPRL